jgi:hypothetical protein
MAKITRGEFLGFGAVFAGASVIASGSSALERRPEAHGTQPSTPAAAGPGAEADLIVVNARVHTVDPALPRAVAFAIKNGRFIAVGSTSDIRNLATSRSRSGRPRHQRAGRLSSAAQFRMTRISVDCRA